MNILNEFIIDDKRNIVIINRMKLFIDSKTNKRSCIKFICNICGYESPFIRESIVKNNKTGCPVCAGQKIKIGFNDVATTDPECIKFFQNGYIDAIKYTRGSGKKIIPVCPDCNKVKDKPMPIYDIINEHSIRCTCGDGKSRPEKYMASVLDQLKKSYIWGYRPDWLKGYKGRSNTLELDFYLPDDGIVIEVDGLIGHNKTSKLTSLTLSESKERDAWKDKQVHKNNLKMIRIDADNSDFDYLHSAIEKTLVEHFNLDTVDWNLCDMKATRNIVREVCAYYEENKPIKIIQLAKIFNLNRCTIRGYIKKGIQFNWCS